MRIRELSFRGKQQSKNSRFVENGNRRIPVLWKTKIREFRFCGKRESENFRFAENENPLNSSFVKNENGRILALWKTRIPIFVKNENGRIPVLWKTGTGEFSFSGFSFSNKTSNTLVSFDNNSSGCFWDSPATNIFPQYQFTKIPKKNP